MLRNFAGMVPHLFEVFVWGRWSGFHLARQLAQCQHADLLRRGFGDRAERFLCPPCLPEFIVELLLWMQGCVLIIKVVWYSIFLIISQFRKITRCTLHQFSWTFYLKFNKTIRADLEASCACFWTTNVYLVGMNANHFTIPRLLLFVFLVSEITIVQKTCTLKKKLLVMAAVLGWWICILNVFLLATLLLLIVQTCQTNVLSSVYSCTYGLECKSPWSQCWLSWFSWCKAVIKHGVN